MLQRQQPVEIIIVPLDAAWRVSVKDHAPIWEEGQTKDEALGKFLRSYGQLFGINISEPL